jgi:serine phosphatase RsbU (regulator of sigma subunit)
MSVHFNGSTTSRSTTQTIAEAITPKRLSQRMWEAGRPFELALLTPLLAMVLIAVLDILTPHLQIYRLLGAGPALASAMWPVAGTLLIGLLALMTDAALSSSVNHDLTQMQGYFTLIAITIITSAAAYGSRIRQQRERTLTEVRAVAETVQRVLLRPIPHHLGEVDIRVLYQAAAAHARIGGDFYEVLQTSHGVRMIIGDVRGKGLPAVEVASVMLAAFRVQVHEAPDMPYLAGRLEISMNQYAEAFPSDEALERFVTVLLVEIPTGEPIARLVNCGHPPPLLLHGTQVREVKPSAPSPPVNMADLIGDDYQVDTIPFTVGDRLLLYTDGVSETRDHSGTFYPLTQRIRRWVCAPPCQLLDSLRKDLLAYVAGTRDDDVAALVAHRVAQADHGP